MNISALQQTNYWTDYVGYEAVRDAKTDAFYDGLSSATEKYSTKGEGNIGKEHIDYQKILQEIISEIALKIKNGDTEQTYQIGGRSFTEKEWNELLEKFDSVEDAIREHMREEQKQKEAEQLKENTVTQEESTMLVSESTMCSYPTNSPDDEDIRYITWYTEEGIFCKKAGQTEGCEWTVPFESKEQYDKVMGFIDKFPSDWNFRFAAHENFWKDYLNGTIDEEAFMDFMAGTDNGVPDYLLVQGDSVYIDMDKIKWVDYLNPLGSRFFTAEEFHKQQMEILAVNDAKLPKISMFNC